ncbi:MAG: metallophosphoesterase [Methanospirillaceae archaeon]|nr:metallophosphoesterase [Methanospirillaceae archaeon]
MMNALLLADLHGEYGMMGSFMDLNPDIVFIAGDITNMGPVKGVETCFSRINVPSFSVPGNCDPEDVVTALEHSSSVNLHGSVMNLGKLTLVGIGGSNPTPFGTPLEYTDKQLDDILKKPVERMQRSIHNVLISHTPPYGILDFIGGNHVGSATIRKYADNFDLVCCAHVHENRGIHEENGIKFVNPGPAAERYCAMIHFGEEPKEIEIELLTV